MCLIEVLVPLRDNVDHPIRVTASHVRPPKARLSRQRQRSMMHSRLPGHDGQDRSPLMEAIPSEPRGNIEQDEIVKRVTGCEKL